MRPWPALFALACVTGGTLDDDTGGEDTGDDTGDDTELDTSAPDVAIDPQTLTWGVVAPGCTEAKPLTVSNAGDLTLGVAAIVPPSSAYQVVGDLPVDLPPGEAATFSVVFAPSGVGSFTGSLRVQTDDPDEPQVLVAVSGTGGAPTATDAFTQGAPTKVDVLWVIDTSASMSGVLSELEAQFHAFVDVLKAAGVDFQMGLTTSDMETVAPGSQGTLAGSPAVWTSAMTTEALVDAFDDAVAVADGSATEQPFAAAHAALESPGHAVTAGLVRSDARVAVIVVADEDDQSTGTVDGYTQWLEAYEVTPDDARFDALMPLAAGGTNPLLLDSCLDVPGMPRLEGAVSATGGRAEDLCEDMEDALTRLAIGSIGLRDRLALSSQPTGGPSGMSVTVGGAVVPFDPFRTDGWTYDAGTNTVVLHGASVPDPGQEVAVTYPLAGDCL